MSTNPVPNARQLSMSRSMLSRTLQSRYADQARLQVEMATGKKISKSSDDPTSHGIVQRLDTVVRQYDQFTRSVEAAISWTNNTQDTLESIANLMSSAYEEGIRGANGTLDGDSRARIAERLDSLLVELVDRLNTRTADGYLFAGTNTAQKPFVLDNGAGADAAGVTYAGNASTQERVVGVEMRVPVGISGSRMTDAGGVSLTGAVASLRDALLGNDQDAIQSALASVIQARDHAINLTSESGVAASRLDDIRVQIAGMNLRIQEQRSGLEDADLAQTVTEIQRSQLGLQAALQAISQVYQTSILNYLR